MIFACTRVQIIRKAESKILACFHSTQRKNPREPEDAPFYGVNERREMIYLSSDHHYFMVHDPTLLHGVETRPWRRG